MSIRSEYLDLAIAMGVVFFLASLVVSGLNELVQWILRIRAKFLWAFLHDLIAKAGNKALPAGKAGIVNLQGQGNDKRPTVRSGTTGSAQERAETRPELARMWTTRLATDPPAPSVNPVRPAHPEAPLDTSVPPVISASERSAAFLQLIGHALDPIDAPQLTGKKKNAQRSGISHVPPTSLAQAFLEVFAEVGRTRVDDGLMQLTRDLVSGAGPVTTAEGMFAGLGTAQRAALYAALAHFVDQLRAAQDNDDQAGQDAAGRDLTVELAAIEGFRPASPAPMTCPRRWPS